MVNDLIQTDRMFIDHLRGILIFRVILAHLGLSWIWMPYSSYIGIFLPPLFAISGAVSLYSFYRSSNIRLFLLKRLPQLLVTYYVILIFGYCATLLEGHNIQGNIINILLLNIPNIEMPIPLGQVWFLRTLIISTIICVPIFQLSQNNRNWLLLPIAIATALSTTALTTDHSLYLEIPFGNKLNIQQPLIASGFYCLGAWLIGSNRNKAVLFLISVSLFVSSYLVSNSINNFNYVLEDHAYQFDLYYFLLGSATLLCLLSFEKIFESTIKIIKPINGILLFFSKHAFIIFLIHGYFIYLSEEYFGLLNVSANIPAALLKITFVIAGSCAISLLLTPISKLTTIKIQAMIINNKNPN